MSGVQLLEVSGDEGAQRLDRWMKRRFPQLTQVMIEKLCRTGQVRIDSARAKASDKTYVISMKVDAHDGWTKEGHTWWEIGTPETSERAEVRTATWPPV